MAPAPHSDGDASVELLTRAERAMGWGLLLVAVVVLLDGFWGDGLALGWAVVVVVAAGLGARSPRDGRPWGVAVGLGVLAHGLALGWAGARGHGASLVVLGVGVLVSVGMAARAVNGAVLGTGPHPGRRD